MNTLQNIRTADSEFPSSIIDVKIPKHWEDTSWHNDTCPSFQVDRGADNGFVRVYVDYIGEDDREFEDGARFGVCLLDEHGDYLEDVIDTDSWLEVLTTVKQMEW